MELLISLAQSSKQNLRILLFVIILFPFISKAQTDTLHIKLYFDLDRSELTSKHHKTIKQNLDSIQLDSVLHISIVGYCDERGSTEYNDVLSNKRARSVYNYFSNNQSYSPPAPQDMEYSGMGELALSHTSKQTVEKQRNENRRVDIWVLFQGPEPDIIVSTEEPEIILMDVKPGDTLVFQNILFVGGRHILLPESYPTLRSLYELLLARTEIRINIMGHVCCTNDPDGMDLDTNRPELSVNRAKAIFDYLAESGIDPDRMEYEGLGSKYKLGGADKYDRRVEIEVLE